MSEKIIPQGKPYSADQWHMYCKSRFLGCADYPMPNGKTISLPNSTAGLDVQEFSDYADKVEAFANTHGAFLEDREFAC